MDAVRFVQPQVRPKRVLVWWLAGAIVVLAGLWAGPGAWAKGIGTCGEGTVPGPCGVNDGAGTTFNTAVTINVLANDIDSVGQGLRVTGVSTATDGVVAINNGTIPGVSVTYTPDNGFSGVDRFSYSLADATGVGAQAEVVVVVAPEGRPAPSVGSLRPNQNNRLQFTQTAFLDGNTAPISLTVQVGPGTFGATPGISDTLAVVVSTVLTPAGPVDGMTGAGLAPASADADNLFLFYRYANYSMNVDALLNKQSLQQNILNKPMTLTVSLDDTLLIDLNSGSLLPAHWDGGAWSSTGIQVVGRDPNSNQVAFTIDRVIGELSFFARPEAEILMPQIYALRLPPVSQAAASSAP